jgi:hypothetical protein
MLTLYFIEQNSYEIIYIPIYNLYSNYFDTLNNQTFSYILISTSMHIYSGIHHSDNIHYKNMNTLFLNILLQYYDLYENNAKYKIYNKMYSLMSIYSHSIQGTYNYHIHPKLYKDVCINQLMVLLMLFTLDFLSD